MNRQILRIIHGERKVRYVVRVAGDKSPTEGSEGYQALISLLQSLVEAPTLLRHAGDCPAQVVIKPGDVGWIVEAQMLPVLDKE